MLSHDTHTWSIRRCFEPCIIKYSHCIHNHLAYSRVFSRYLIVTFSSHLIQFVKITVPRKGGFFIDYYTWFENVLLHAYNTYELFITIHQFYHKYYRKINKVFVKFLHFPKCTELHFWICQQCCWHIRVHLIELPQYRQ